MHETMDLLPIFFLEYLFYHSTLYKTFLLEYTYVKYICCLSKKLMHLKINFKYKTKIIYLKNFVYFVKRKSIIIFFKCN